MNPPTIFKRFPCGRTPSETYRLRLYSNSRGKTGQSDRHDLCCKKIQVQKAAILDRNSGLGHKEEHPL